MKITNKRIAILGPVFVNVNIELDEHFNSDGNNKGTASTSYSSIWMKLAKRLSTENSVRFLTALDTEAEVAVISDLKGAGVNTDYIVTDKGAMGFNIAFHDNVIHRILHYPDIDAVKDVLAPDQKLFYSNIDVLVMSDIDKDVVDSCNKFGVKVYWMPGFDEDLEPTDDDFCQLVNEGKVEILKYLEAIE